MLRHHEISQLDLATTITLFIVGIITIWFFAALVWVTVIIGLLLATLPFLL